MCSFEKLLNFAKKALGKEGVLVIYHKHAQIFCKWIEFGTGNRFG